MSYMADMESRQDAENATKAQVGAEIVANICFEIDSLHLDVKLFRAAEQEVRDAKVAKRAMFLLMMRMEDKYRVPPIYEFYQRHGFNRQTRDFQG